MKKNSSLSIKENEAKNIKIRITNMKNEYAKNALSIVM